MGNSFSASGTYNRSSPCQDLQNDWETCGHIEPFTGEFLIKDGLDAQLEDDVPVDELISEPGDRFYWDYDFGDGCRYRIKLEQVESWDEGYPDAFDKRMRGFVTVWRTGGLRYA